MESYTSEIMLFPSHSPSFPIPRRWMECDGQLLDIKEYATLFSLLGTKYGGDGKTNFSTTAVQRIIDKLTEDPSWRGLRETGSGRPRKTTAKEDEKIVQKQ